MKKRLIVTALLILVLVLSGCGSSTKSRADQQNNKVEDVLKENMDKSDKKKSQSADAQTQETEKESEKEASEEAKPDPSVDIDLTVLNKTLVFSEVSNMMLEPEKYIGTSVKMRGVCGTYHDANTGKYYFTCVIKDAKACCRRGIEFVLTDDYAVPDDYPRDGTQAVIKGVFDTYTEDGQMYCTLRNGVLVD